MCRNRARSMGQIARCMFFGQPPERTESGGESQNGASIGPKSGIRTPARETSGGAFAGAGARPVRFIDRAEACVRVEKTPPGGARKSYKLGKSLPFYPLARLRAERVGVRGRGAESWRIRGCFYPGQRITPVPLPSSWPPNGPFERRSQGRLQRLAAWHNACRLKSRKPALDE